MPTQLKGYMGEYALVDLSSGEISRYGVTDDERAQFMGNKIQAGAILHKLLPTKSEPLSLDNVLIFNTGPLTGSGAPTSAKFSAAAKSPLTGGIGTSNCGGDFGYKLKNAGFDGIIITGKAKKPVYIDIKPDSVSIQDASHLWGLDTERTQQALPSKAGKVVIGPAGENQVLYAAVMSGERALGRCGMGAVMGSKNLKAVIADGNQRLSMAEPEKFREFIKNWTAIIKAHPSTGDELPRLGTSHLVLVTNRTHTLATRNYRRGSFEHAEDVSGERMAATRLVKNYGCKLCPIHCGRLVEYQGKQFKGPEFETIGQLGPNLENRDLDKIIEWNRQLDLLGLDTITTGVTLGFAMELKERGMLDTKLEFGKTEHISEMIEDIAYKRGLGADLAMGTKRMADKYGGHEFAMNSKGLEFAAYEPRGAVGHGLGYATSNRGGCHLNGGYMVYWEATGPLTIDPLAVAAKPGYCIFQQDSFEAISASGTCLFTAYAVLPGFAGKLNTMPVVSSIVKEALTLSHFLVDHLADMPQWALNFHAPMIPHAKAVELLTGIKLSLGKFLAIGERGFNLERLLNLREGLTKSDDSLPRRLTHELQRADEPKSKVPLDQMLPRYYKLRGWDADGIPTRDKLRSLGIEWAMM